MLIIVLAGCRDEDLDVPLGASTPPTIVGSPDGCAVTLAVPPSAVPEEASRPILAGSSNPELTRAQLSMYGNDAMWVTIPREAQLDTKLGTVRLIPGQLTATGRRLDSPAPPAEFVIPDGYGPIGFQAVGVRFPTPGCWEVTHRLADRELRFTISVAPAKTPSGTALPAPTGAQRVPFVPGPETVLVEQPRTRFILDSAPRERPEADG